MQKLKLNIWDVNIFYVQHHQDCIRPDIDNLIIKISCYNKGGLVVNGHSNVLIELRCVKKIINKKNDYETSLFFTALKEKCVGKYYLDIKECDKLEMTNELQMKLFELMNKLSNKHYKTFKYNMNKHKNE